MGMTTVSIPPYAKYTLAAAAEIEDIDWEPLRSLDEPAQPLLIECPDFDDILPGDLFCYTVHKQTVAGRVVKKKGNSFLFLKSLDDGVVTREHFGKGRSIRLTRGVESITN